MLNKNCSQSCDIRDLEMKDTGKKISNLITNQELTELFQKEIKSTSEVYLRQKYHMLGELATPEDVVIECWIKILRTGMDWDSSRGKLSTFSRVIVDGVCLDMWRKHQRHYGNISLEYEMGNSDTADSFSDIIKDYNTEFEDEVALKSVIKECCEEFNGIDLESIINNRREGLRDGVQARKEGIRVRDIKKFMGFVEEIVEDRMNDEERTLADILYGDEEGLLRQRDKLEFTLSFIKDDRKRFSLGDIVKRVIDGFTYREIADDFGVSCSEVKLFLDKYQLMVI
jgi:DNA-directed RNA polymerase specialized sigma24 family protein